MKVIITDCNKPTIEQELIFASKFFLRELFSKQMYNNIGLEVVMKNKMEDLGNCRITFYNDWYKPRDFEIHLRKNRSLKFTLQILAHEMVHVKQFAKGELNPSQTRWKSKTFDTAHTSYWDLPWEIEATSLEHILYKEYSEYRNKIT